jgi:hypothetical protein
MPVIPAQGRLRQEDHEIDASLDYMGRSYLKNKAKQNKISRGEGEEQKTVDVAQWQ